MNGRLFSNDRLVVRNLRTTDIAPFFDMQSNPNVMRYIKPAMDYAQSEKELNRFIQCYSDPAEFFKIGAALDNENDFVGLCGLYKNDKDEYEVAYRLREAHWGKGLGKSMATATIEYAFKVLNLPELVAYVHQDNLGSVRILEAQMAYVGEFICPKTQWPERKYRLRHSVSVL